MSDGADTKTVDGSASLTADAPAPSAPAPSAIETNGTKAVPKEDTLMGDAQIDAPVPKDVQGQQPPKNDPSLNEAGSIEDTTASKEPATDGSVMPPTDAAAPESESAKNKAKTPTRRKSGAGPEHKRKLNKKGSKANLTHTDAKPGDHYFARLKGFPPWPVIICDEDMLPYELIKSRPASAAREDGTYREGYQDDGPKVKDRTFAIMYLHTNEFGWHKNTELQELDFETVGDVPAKMRKDLQEAHILAAKKHDLDYYKEVLKNFMEQKEANRLAQQEAADAKAAKAAAKVKKDKAKTQKAVIEDYEDVDMAEADIGGDSDETGSVPKKRKADDEATPSDPNKKVKLAIKFKAPNTPNGTSTSKGPKDTNSAKSSVKSKAKKATSKVNATPEAAASSKEPELTVEEKRAKKEKEILFLRHKLQKGLLTRDQPPKEDEMKQMSEFISKLEGYSELEVSIIRATKINKVLKAIIKLSSIPKEEEFNFKSRSQTLLDKWNKLLANDQTVPGVTSTTSATNGTPDTKVPEEAKTASVEPASGPEETHANEAPGEKNDDTKPAAPETKEDNTVSELNAAVTEDSNFEKAVADATTVEDAA